MKKKKIDKTTPYNVRVDKEILRRAQLKNKNLAEAVRRVIARNAGADVCTACGQQIENE